MLLSFCSAVADDAAYQLQQIKDNMATKATKVGALHGTDELGDATNPLSLHIPGSQLKQMTSGFFSDLQTRYS
jgi:hypothetical protein